MNLSNRVALVTGAGRGIGAAIAMRLAQSGAAIAVDDRDLASASSTAARITAETGRVTVACGADVTDSAAVKPMVVEVAAKLGPISILVNNAGILRNAPLADMTEEDWDLVMNVHAKGAFLCSRAVAPMMAEGKWGRIVNISSGAAWGSDRGHANYSSAKAAILGLTRTLAIELGPNNITTNAVAPGAIESEMTRATAEQLGITFDEYRRTQAQRVPLRRLGQPDDVADVVGFLCSEAAGYVNGQVIFVGGGPGPQ